MRLIEEYPVNISQLNNWHEILFVKITTFIVGFVCFLMSFFLFTRCKFLMKSVTNSRESDVMITIYHIEYKVNLYSEKKKKKPTTLITLNSGRSVNQNHS